MTTQANTLNRRQFVGTTAGVFATGLVRAQDAPRSSLYLIGALAHQVAPDEKRWLVGGVQGHNALLVVRGGDLSQDDKKSFKRIQDTAQVRQLQRVHSSMGEFGESYYALCLSSTELSIGTGDKAPTSEGLRLPQIASVRSYFKFPEKAAPALSRSNTSFLAAISGGWLFEPAVRTAAPAHGKKFAFRLAGKETEVADYPCELTDLHAYSRFGATKVKIEDDSGNTVDFTIREGSLAWIISGYHEQGKNPNVFKHGDGYFKLFGDVGPPRAQTVGLEPKPAVKVTLPCVSLALARQSALGRLAEEDVPKADLIPPDTDFCYQAGI